MRKYEARIQGWVVEDAKERFRKEIVGVELNTVSEGLQTGEDQVAAKLDEVIAVQKQKSPDESGWPEFDPQESFRLPLTK
jgi:hypothetical protein